MLKKLMLALPVVAMMSGAAIAADDYPDRSIRFIIASKALSAYC